LIRFIYALLSCSERDSFMQAIKGIYRPRQVRSTPLWKIMDRWWERFLGDYDDCLQKRYGYLRPIVRKTGEQYLKCGLADYGFARVRCPDCSYEYLLTFSCRRKICPSCAKKRQIQFGEFLVEEVLENISHRHLVFSLPRRLRPFFHYNRRLLAKLSKCAYDTVQELMRAEAGMNKGMCAAVNVIHTWGDLLDFHSHTHGLFAWGLFDEEGNYRGAPPIPEDSIRDLFMHKVFKMLLKEDVISEEVVENILSWRHSGFHIYVGPLVSCLDEKSLENLGQYNARGPVSLARTSIIPGATDDESKIEDDGAPGISEKVIITSPEYKKKHKGNTRVLNPLDYIAEVCQHIPDKFEKTVLYYGWYSNRKRGQLKKESRGSIQVIEEPKEESSLSTSEWARLIRKVYEIDPLICPHCGSLMKIIAVIERPAVIFKILQHLDLLGKDPPADEYRPPPSTREWG